MLAGAFIAGCSTLGLEVVNETAWLVVSGGVEDGGPTAGWAGGAAGAEVCCAPALTERANTAERKHSQRFMLVPPRRTVMKQTETRHARRPSSLLACRCAA